MTENAFQYFLDMICAPSIIIFGLIANLIIIMVLSRKAFDKTPSRNFLRVLAISDFSAILGMIPYYGSPLE